jgi:predicted dehydrogenase/nucleoside-diphosphate-sugar epimerase
MGRHHARAIARLGPSASLVAVADPSASAREAIFNTYPAAQAFESVDALLSAVRPDVVHVCTAPDTHEAVATAAINAGCHVYVEKPFVTTVHAARRLLALATAHRVSACVGHQLLFEPVARALLEALPLLGQVVHVESYFSFRTVRRSPDGRAPLRADQQLVDILPHSVSLLLRILAANSPGETELTHVEVGPAGTVHALVRRGGMTGALVVTLEGRPIESYVRVVGSNGTLHADFVRGTLQRQIGPGTSGIDKALAPFRLAWQLGVGTSKALGGRVLKRQRSYPGLTQIFSRYYASIGARGPSPTPPEEILDTVRICGDIAGRLTTEGPETSSIEATSRCVLVTGGTGFLGRSVVRALNARGARVRVLARRLPSEWERIAGVEYVACDLADQLDAQPMEDVHVIVHCAAETAGGKAAHERNSIGATDRLLRVAAKAGVRSVVHVSSLAVLASSPPRKPLDETSSLEAARERCGPYVWGKLESERIASELGAELGLDIKIVRPGAIIDYNRFEPPGRIGKRLGNIFVAVGPRRSKVGTVDVDFAGHAIAWMAMHVAEAPGVINLLTPDLPTRRELVARLRSANPDLSVLWLPRAVVQLLSWLALPAQRILRPGTPPMNIARAFASQTYDTRRAAELARTVAASFSNGTEAPEAETGEVADEEIAVV